MNYTVIMKTTFNINEDCNVVHVDHDILDAVSNGTHYAPHDVLGAHLPDSTAKWASIRVLRPLAKTVKILTSSGSFEALHEHNGVFVAKVPAEVSKNRSTTPDYRVQVSYDGVTELCQDDPYRHMPTIGEMDLYLFGEGRHEQLWKVLGAKVLSFDDPLGDAEGEKGQALTGTSFTIWAPGARAIRVVGNFNHWDGRTHAMRSLGTSGVWELFIPGVAQGEVYKFEILTAQGNWVMKADPMERAHELPPRTGSIVVKSQYSWKDASWLNHRKEHNAHLGPMSIYEVHASSWRTDLHTYRELAEELVRYVSNEGFTHVEFMPLAQHPFAGSWGYQVTGYYAVDSRLGSPDEFKYLVDSLHQAGIGVIMDWVPAHFPKDDFSLGRFDGTALYEDPNPLRGEHPDWGTYIFNYGRREVRNFLVANACFWMDEYHIDGLRVDAVSSMIYLDYSRNHGEWEPNQFGGRENLEAIDFMKEANATAYKNYPGIVMIAEESTAFGGVTTPTLYNGLGFGLKWNMGWMHDTLNYMHELPVNRSWHHGTITFSMVYAYSEHYVLPLSHDEVVYGKGSLLSSMPGDDWQRFASVRALFAYQWTHPGKKLTFMGNEFAQTTEWSQENGLQWHETMQLPHHQQQLLVKDLNALYRKHSALWSLDFDPAGFSWINCGDSEHNVLSYMRTGSNGEQLVIVANFSGVAWQDYQVGFPHEGTWSEILSTDDLKYGGSGIYNGQFETVDQPSQGMPCSAQLTIPALGVTIFERIG